MIDKYIYKSHFLKLEEEMIEEHNHILNNYQVTNAHNKYTKEIYANNIKDYFFLNKTYKLIVGFLSELNIYNALEFEKVWVQKIKFENITKDTLPYIPHFDQLRKFKVFIYLNKLREKRGSTFILKNSLECKYIEKLRIALPNNYKELKLNIVKKFGLSEYDGFNINEGDLLCFDTNRPHFFKNLNQNEFRLNYRFDFNYHS